MRPHVHFAVDASLIAAGIGLYPVGGLMPLAWMAGAWMAVTAWGVLNPRSSLYMPVWWRLPPECPDIALTFDDGPNPDTTPAVLDLLGEHRQHATFFLIGEHVRRHPQLVRRMVDEGHAVGLHSHTHRRLLYCAPPGAVRRDLEACRAAIADATGMPPPRLFRPMAGLKHPIVGLAVERLRLHAVTWSYRAFDTGAASPDAIVARLERGLRPRSILAMHDGFEPARPRDRSTCVAVLRRLLATMRERALHSTALEAADGGVRPRHHSSFQ